VIDAQQAMWLGLVQGLTEFLPISSSGHLILVTDLLGWPDQGLAFDVAVHLGTLLAVLAYFRRDVAAIIGGWLLKLRGGDSTPEARLGGLIVIGTVPAVIAGLLLGSSIDTVLRNPLVIVLSTIFFGLVLWWADAKGRRERQIDSLTGQDALLIGIAQALALIPGTSRSGITLTAGLALGLDRSAAARFSFLMAIPVILAATLFKLIEFHGDAFVPEWTVFGIGVALAAVSAFGVIGVFLRLIERLGVLPFVLYRLVLGALLFYWYL
jgi:undecaprenyl-diphosphatase|tara:strand:+ start:400 stop:1200 length:801 start_codon:yes stop_codon:yes gene_type:complete